MAFIVELAAPAVAAGGSGTRCAATIDGRDDVFGVVSAARSRPFEMCSAPTEDSKTKRSGSRRVRPPDAPRKSESLFRVVEVPAADHADGGPRRRRPGLDALGVHRGLGDEAEPFDSPAARRWVARFGDETRRERSIFRAMFEERGVEDTMTGRGAALYNGGVRSNSVRLRERLHDDRQK